MEIAIYWPAHFLARAEHLMRAVNLVALAHSVECGSEWVAGERGGYADTWRQRQDKGCEIIARGLHADIVAGVLIAAD
ncbi:hypothetical protein QA649_04990 [Bradyrhizobium sp. CB1717]|uniref:hypothetical protein n=1 Tax=Bradyrhizobium sp. CB1717 TaxID=3039154 RepID=UPI0024B09245|nr:hypothetical protein [Bradyrhizobium sp. CB1717]WFU25571.1 hypothetical protein QA649_04990 [Bradyrhizobium sp. CB1717]